MADIKLRLREKMAEEKLAEMETGEQEGLETADSSSVEAPVAKAEDPDIIERRRIAVRLIQEAKGRKSMQNDIINPPGK